MNCLSRAQLLPQDVLRETMRPGLAQGGGERLLAREVLFDHK